MAGDTIFALATPAGRSGVSVVRLSGPRAGPVLAALSGGGLPSPRRARLTAFRDPETGGLLDEGLALWFPGPQSFSGEDMAELQLHGAPAVVAAVLGTLGRQAGLRPAEPGEFTRRAFEAGRLDLTEVEGLADLLAAETEAQRRQALRQLEGGLAVLLADWSGELTRRLAHLEAVIDFGEEEGIPEALITETQRGLMRLAGDLRRALSASRVGETLREGLSVAILGAPNVGKSTLLNRLARREAAIVSELAGTTRDVVEVRLDLAGYPVVLADTAGLRAEEETRDPIEREGMRRSLARAEAADLKLVLFDLRSFPQLDPATAALLDEATLVLFTKSDLASPESLPAAAAFPGVPLSLVTGDGFESFLDELEARVAVLFRPALEAPLFTRERHRHALEECIAALERGQTAGELALLAEDCRLALRALGRIAGRVDVEDLLDVIFRDFCIGK